MHFYEIKLEVTGLNSSTIIEAGAFSLIGEEVSLELAKFEEGRKLLHLFFADQLMECFRKKLLEEIRNSPRVDRIQAAIDAVTASLKGKSCAGVADPFGSTKGMDVNKAIRQVEEFLRRPKDA